MRIHTDRTRSSRSGSALAVALIAVMTIATMCAVLLQISGRASREHSTSIDNLRALYIAEAGLAEAFNGLYAGKNGEVGTAEVPASFGGGVYWVEAEEQVAGVVLLKSVGLYRSGRKCVQLAVEVYEPSPLALGVFGANGLRVGAGSTITSFGSQAQPYSEFKASIDSMAGLSIGEAVVAKNGGISLSDVGSNQGIIVAQNSTIAANLVPGVGRVADVGANVTLMGTASPRTAAAELPVPEIPEMPLGGDLTASLGSTTLADGASRRLRNVVVQPGASLAIRGPADIVLNSLTVNPGATLEFDSSNGDIRLFVGGEFMLKSGSTVVSATEDTGGVQLLLYATNDPANYPAYQQAQIELGSTGSFYGYVYAPNSTILIQSPFRVIGGAAARALILAENASVALDYDLCNTGGQGAESLWPVSWSIQALPDETIVSDRRDPFIQLQENGVTAVKSADAHSVKAFRIAYVDVDGVQRRFDGVEAMFDWTGVNTINRLWREGEAVPFPGPMPIPADVAAKANAIKALKDTRDQQQRTGKGQWWRKRRWD